MRIIGVGLWLALGIGCAAACSSSSNVGAPGGAGAGASADATGGAAGAHDTNTAGGEADAGAAGAAQGNALDLNASAGKLGGDCETDADCDGTDLTCISPAGYPTGTKYCAPTCSKPADCGAFAHTSYAIPVPLDPDGFGNNAWNSTLLSRGVVCGPSPDLGGTQKYCQFICVENAAANADLTSCSCLPRYKRITNADGQITRCDWDDASQCSPLVYPGRRDICDACNSKPLLDGCYTGQYFCSFNRSFNGNCTDGSLNINSYEACIASTTSDCDATCYEACAGSGEGQPGFATTDNCTKLCCKPGGRPATQAPQCTDPGAGGASSAGASAGGSSTGGTASAGSSSGGNIGTAGHNGGGGTSSGGTIGGGTGGSKGGGTAGSAGSAAHRQSPPPASAG